MSKDRTWKTAITNIQPNKIMVRGQSIDQLMGNISYAQAVFLLLKGERPSVEQGRMMDAILVSSVDHGVVAPSTLAARTVATTGVSLTAALASGILAIGRYHGGAVEECMEMLLELEKRKREQGRSIQVATRELVQEYQGKGKRLSGFGHRVHTSDPRTRRLFGLAEELGIAGDFVKMARALEDALFLVLAKRLPLNVDGAIAAVLCEMGFPPPLGNAFFIISRVPGLIAHISEEWIREKPMRVINPAQWEYDGPKGP